MKRALVTGGTRGIGAAISRGLKEAGHEVIAIYAGNDTAAAEFSQANDIQVYKWDVSQFEACTHHMAIVKQNHGSIDILVNNAGIIRDGMLHKMTHNQWQEVINTNLNSCFNMSRCVIEDMRAQGYGRIINISSVNGIKGQMGQTNYSAAKAAMIGFTRALAQESAAKGITINAVAPGYIATEMVSQISPQVLEGIIQQIPIGRLGLPAEIAAAVVYLASEQASFTTGSVLNINGGQYFG